MTIPSTAEQVCPNCRRLSTKHRPWCETYKTVPEPMEGDIVDHPLIGPTELLSVYLREQAIEDGVLVDCTQDLFDDLNRDAGVIFDVAMTHIVFERYVAVPKEFAGSQDIKGRYWDILFVFRRAAKQKQDFSELLFDLVCIPNGRGLWANECVALSPEQRLIRLKAVAGPGDRGEPCITFMLPTED